MIVAKHLETQFLFRSSLTPFLG